MSQTLWPYGRRVLLLPRARTMGRVAQAAKMRVVRVALFTECYRPVVNGVVASIDALRCGLHAAAIEVTTIAPYVPHHTDSDDDIVRIPSLPLPTRTGYRLCLPYLRDRARLDAAIVHAHSPFVTGMMAASYARRRGVPLVFTYHTRLDAYAHYAPIDRAFAQRALVSLTRRYANSAAAVIAPTVAIERRLREIGVRARIEVIASAIDVRRFAAGRRSEATRAWLGAREGRLLLLAVARLGREKNLELAIAALARLPECCLAIVGDGPHRDALTGFARSLGVADRVRFAGAVDSALLPDLYASADTFVFPSLTDTQGLVLAEAMATGLPVVAASGEVAREVLGDAGRFAPADDPAALAAQIAAALSSGRNQNAVHLAQSRFSIEAQTGRVVHLYEELIAANLA